MYFFKNLLETVSPAEKWLSRNQNVKYFTTNFLKNLKIDTFFKSEVKYSDLFFVFYCISLYFHQYKIFLTLAAKPQNFEPF